MEMTIKGLDVFRDAVDGALMEGLEVFRDAVVSAALQAGAVIRGVDIDRVNGDATVFWLQRGEEEYPVFVSGRELRVKTADELRRLARQRTSEIEWMGADLSVTNERS